MGEPTDATGRYAAALRRLHEAAGSPTGGAIERQAAAQLPPRKITPQSWSDWRNGRNVPSQQAVAAFLIGHLRNLARRRGADRGVPSDQWWEETRRAALAERRSGPGRGGRPAQAHPTVFPGLVREATLRIDRETVSYGHAGEVPLAEHPRREADHGLEGLLWRLARARARGTTGTVVRQDALVRETGRKLGSVFLDGPAGDALAAGSATAARERSVLRLGVDVAEDLFDLPWETLVLPGHDLPLVLTPGVEMHRLVPGPPAARTATAAPLRILAVVASPDGQDGGALLDMERELRTILDAVEPAKRHAAAYVRVLNEGTLASVHEALRQERFHVLHISCHARPGFLALEDRNGRVDTVSAARLAEAVPRGGEVPLIVLSGCSTALGGEVVTGLARGLVDAGMPMVLAMTAPVSDQYATRLAAALYRGLALHPRPEVPAALSEARRELTEGRDSGEWATSALFMRGPSRPLYDVAHGVDTGVAPPRPVLLDPAVVVRGTGEFVGRRTEIRTLLRALRGGSPGVLIQGLGGVGKTVLAAELVSRLGAEAGLVVSTSGRTSPDQILAETAGRLLASTARDGDGAAPLRNLAGFIEGPANDIGGSWRVRLGALAGLIGESPVTLLLDNFEENLVSATEHSFLDEELAAFMAAWTSAGGRLIVTCRYPVDLPGGALRTLHLGPLLLAEARKLMWRLPGLDALPIEDRQRAWANVGGHPRTLEYVDALLRSGRANFPDITRRLEALPPRSPEAGRPGAAPNTAGPSLDTAMAEAITLAVAETLLSDLVDSLDPLAQIVLAGASVFRLPCTRAGLAWLCSPPENERDTIVAHHSGLLEELRRERPDAELEDLGLTPEETGQIRSMMTGAISLPQGPAGLDQAIRSLVDLSLVVRIETDEPSQALYLTHRWTASTLQRLLADGDSTDLVRRAHLAATGYWWAVGHHEPIREVAWLEKRHHLHAAGDLDGALSATGDLAIRLRHRGAHALAGSLLLETLGWFPEPDLRRAKTLDALSLNAEDLDDLTKARDFTEESREINEREDDREGLLANFHRLARLTRMQGDYEEAARWNDRSRDLAEDLNDRYMLANTYHESSLLAEHRASFEDALTWARRALDLRLAIDDRRGVGASHHLLGVITHQQRALDSAHGWFQKALDVALTSGYRSDEAVAYHELGLIAQERGDLDGAVTWTRKGVVLNEQIGGRTNLSAGYYQLGSIAFTREEPDEALHWFTRSLALSDQAGDQMGSADTRLALGVLAEARGALDEAYDLFAQAHATYEALGHAPRAAGTAADLARVVAARQSRDAGQATR